MLAILSSAASSPHSYDFTTSVSQLSDKSRQLGMVQPVVNEMFATVHAAGSSLLGLFTSCTTFDSTRRRVCPMASGLSSHEMLMRTNNLFTPPKGSTMHYDDAMYTAPASTRKK
eukprot:scaffold23756_cov120-Isochrysis_galbana.AAC.2